MRIVFGGFCKELLAVGGVVYRGRLGREGRRQSFGMGQLECAIHLIGRDVVESFSFVFLRQRLPVEFGGLEHGERTEHIGACEGERVFYRAVYVALGGEVYHAGHMFFLHEGVDGVEVADVGAHKTVVRFLFNIFQVGEVAGVGQFIDIDDAVLWVFVDKESNHMAADKPGPARNNNRLHDI